MKDRPRRNYLLLGAALLTVGLLVEFLSQKVVELHMNVFYKTTIIMFMIGVGYSFAEGILAPLAKGVLKTMQNPFVRLAGPIAGAALFYIVVYVVLFGLYLLVFIYGMDIGSIPAPKMPLANISA